MYQENNVEMNNEKCIKLDADEAIRRKGTFAESNEDALKRIQTTQDEKFTEIRSLRFGWVKQPSDKDGKCEMKLMSTLPNGKIIFPDRSQNLDDIIPEEPYLCLVFDPPGKKVAFAKILFPEYKPKIYIPPSRIPAMVWRDDKGIVHRKVPHGDTYEKRLITCIKEMEALGMDSVTIIYRKGARE